MRRLLSLLLVCFRIFAVDGAQQPNPSQPKLVKAKPDPLLARLARFLGISLTPPPLIRAGSGQTGTVWLVAADGRGESRQLSRKHGLSWPVFAADGSAVFAVSGEDVIRISVSGKGEAVACAVPGLVKLLGAEISGGDNILGVRLSGGDPVPIALSPGDCGVGGLGPANGHEDALQYLLDSQRDYGSVSLVVDTGSTGGRNVVRVEPGREDVQITNCRDHDCAQPSMSPDRKWVVYVQVD